uniref:25S rRNA (uridine-N(3))-methyltransferase BMT5-like domain-containing protein n=1 Tax=Chenopodium quinoa TaxID=63459 RepID=A0A803LYF7_CHEQI
MGQILSNLWRKICPKPKNEALKSDNHKANYQKLSHNDENQRQSHCINISDHHDVQLISGCSSPNETIESHENNLDHSNNSNIVVDLSSGYEEHAKKKKTFKEQLLKDHVDQVIPEAVLVKNVTTTISHVVSSVKKIGQYNSAQRILLVGEGDFSFSACLAVAFGTATNITATSLNSEDFLIKNYGKFISNKVELVTRGSTVLHDVDAMKMAKHPLVGSLVFDRIIYNFPHSGKFGKDDDDIRTHKKLVRGFIRNAKKMINEDGEIHITSKSNGIYLKWDIPKIGVDQGLNLIQEIKFKASKYPGYHTKYGFGGDKDFDCNPSKTYKFALSSKSNV